LSQREPLFWVANRLGANAAGRNKKREKGREAEDESQHEQPPPICSPLSLRFQTSGRRLASLTARRPGRGPCVSVTIVALPLGRRNQSAVQPSSWARRVLEKSTVNSHPRKLPLPDTRFPSQAARKPQQTPPSASSIEIDVGQEDFAAMTNLARTTAGTVLRTLEARSTPDHRVAACSRGSRWAQLFRKANPFAAPGSDPRGSSSS
jgi:hypothetical protein